MFMLLLSSLYGKVVVHAAGNAFQDSCSVSTKGSRRRSGVVGAKHGPISEDGRPSRQSRLGIYFLPFLPFPGSYFSFQILNCRVSIGRALLANLIASWGNLMRHHGEHCVDFDDGP